MRKRAHGIGLLSGGLDSALAAKVVHDAGADVTCLHFVTGFCITAHRSRVGRRDRPLANPALQVGARNEIRVELVDVSSDYLPMVLAPPHGYGAHMNPCIDCRLFMLRRAKAYLEAVGADFVFTGEVLGQRPLSQRRAAVDLIERESGLEGRLLRPLSAHLFPPTQIEIEGRVDRSRLHGFAGRGRRAQIALAKKYALDGFMSPAGGCCFLADPGYSSRLRDLVRNRGARDITMEDVHLLGVGRHFRLSPRVKVIVGRNETESRYLDAHAFGVLSARVLGDTGATGIATGRVSEVEVEEAASIVARYGKARERERVPVEVRHAGGGSRTLCVAPAADVWLAAVRV